LREKDKTDVRDDSDRGAARGAAWDYQKYLFKALRIRKSKCMSGEVPDHSTFSVNRHGRFRDSEVLRQVFEAVVQACMDAGFVKGEGFAVDASVIEANASRYHGKTPDEIDWSAVERQTRAAAEALPGSMMKIRTPTASRRS
jgi:hypothetical protein